MGRSLVRFRAPSYLATLCLLCSSTNAIAQSPRQRASGGPESGGPPDGEVGGAKADEPVADEAKKADAKTHFEKGLALLQEEAWAAALPEFLASRELFPTRAATTNAATVLRKLQRYDEALDMYEAVLRDFSAIKQEDRLVVQRAVAEMRELVGTVELSGAEPGAAIVVSGQSRGEYPPVTPLRVSAGTHVLRLSKEGFEPFETRIEVAGGQSVHVVAKLHALTASGRLKVTERSGRALDVLVDNAVVGVTPWEGVLSVGSHTALLQGKGRVGSQPAAASVKAGALTSLTLAAEVLDGTLRVEPTPAGASVAIDSVPVGHGVWYGWLKAGTHRVDVASEGFAPVTREARLDPGGRSVVAVQLEPDANSVMWRKPPRWTLEANAGPLFIPSFGGEVAGNCTAPCSTGLGAGGLGFFHAGYQRGSGLGVGLSLGYLIATQSVTGRTTPLSPQGYSPTDVQRGTVTDDLRLSAFLGGATIAYRLDEKAPVLVRLGLGVLAGQLRDQRHGQFVSTQATGSVPYSTFPVADLEAVTSFYIDPEIRVGVRLGDHVDLALGIQVLMLLALSQPSWKQTIEVNAGKDGVGYYPAGTTMGSFVYGLAPTASFRYDLF